MLVYVAFGKHARTGGEQQRVLAPTDFSGEFSLGNYSRWPVNLSNNNIYIYVYIIFNNYSYPNATGRIFTMGGCIAVKVSSPILGGNIL